MPLAGSLVGENLIADVTSSAGFAVQGSFPAFGLVGRRLVRDTSTTYFQGHRTVGALVSSSHTRSVLVLLFLQIRVGLESIKLTNPS